MSRLNEREQDRTYIELHVAELQRMTHKAIGTGRLKFDLGTDVSEADAEVTRTVMRTIAVLARGSERNSVVNTHRLPDTLADALSRILDLAERTGIDLGAALATRLLGGTVDSGRRAP